MDIDVDCVFKRQLKERFNFQFNLKKEQISITTELLKKRDSVGIFPTGYRKSVCFTVFPLLLNEIDKKKHTALIISPLSSLMEDQARSAKAHNINAVIIKSEMDERSIDGIRSGSFSLIFMSPEMLLESCLWRNLILDSKLYQENLCLIAIDEAHILDTWGENFRPTYSRLGELRSHFTDVPFLLLTATTTKDMLKSTCERLHLQTPFIESISPDRTNINLSYKSERGKMDPLNELQWYFEHIKDEGCNAHKALLYVRSVGTVGKLFRDIMGLLQEQAYVPGKSHIYHNRLVGVYHAGLSNRDQKSLLDEFSKGDSVVRIVICTVAFGMGIDIPDIRYVFHWGACESIMEYWQEVGRAGRDGKQAYAYYFVPRSSIVHVGKDMKTFCKQLQMGESECVRSSLISALYGYKRPEKKTCKSKCENECECDLCKCCCICKSRCKCVL